MIEQSGAETCPSSLFVMNFREGCFEEEKGMAEEVTTCKGGVKRQPSLSLPFQSTSGSAIRAIRGGPRCDFILSYSGSGLSPHRHWKREEKGTLFSAFSYTRATRYQYLISRRPGINA
jgi:hypothetical protein